MSWSELVWTTVVVTGLLTAWVALCCLLTELFLIRAAFARCHQCGQRFGRSAVLVAADFYERAYGQGARVMDGPRRYRGAKVVRCPNCGVEEVLGAFGGFVEHFSPLIGGRD
jgi:hypothetical protein